MDNFCGYTFLTMPKLLPTSSSSVIVQTTIWCIIELMRGASNRLCTTGASKNRKGYIYSSKHSDGRLSQFDVLQLALEGVDRVAGHDGRRQIIP